MAGKNINLFLMVIRLEANGKELFGWARNKEPEN